MLLTTFVCYDAPKLQLDESSVNIDADNALLVLLLQHRVPLHDIVMYSILCWCSLRIYGVLKYSMYISRTASDDLSLVVSVGYTLCSNNMLGELTNGCLTVHVLP